MTDATADPYAAYLFAHFVGEASPDGEQLYFSVSRGDTLTEWDQLAGGAPVLRSTLGTGGIRDPFLLRRQDRDSFVILATDLRVFGVGDFREAQEHGSTALLIWESDDLVEWGAPRRVEVVPPEAAGNAWAPEAVWCEELGRYAVYWASNLYDGSVGRRNADSYNRMMIATTTDFVEFSEPKVWIDVCRAPGYGTIDSTVVRHGGRYHRFTKDERPDVMQVFHEQGTELLAETVGAIGSTWELVAERIGSEHIAHGEGPIVVPSNADDRWYLLLDWPPYGGGQGYVLFETDDLASGDWRPLPGALPPRFRHGSVLQITERERRRLLEAMAPAPVPAPAAATAPAASGGVR